MRVSGLSDDLERLLRQLFGTGKVAELLLDSSQVAQSAIEPIRVADPTMENQGILEGLTRSVDITLVQLRRPQHGHRVRLPLVVPNGACRREALEGELTGSLERALSDQQVGMSALRHSASLRRRAPAGRSRACSSQRLPRGRIRPCTRANRVTRTGGGRSRRRRPRRGCGSPLGPMAQARASRKLSSSISAWRRASRWSTARRRCSPSATCR